MKKIKIGDTVRVITGKYKDKTAKIVSINWDNALLEWLNIVKRAKKQQWYQDKHLPINISNLAYQDDDVTSRIWFVVEWGTKVRIVKKTNNKLKN